METDGHHLIPGAVGMRQGGWQRLGFEGPEAGHPPAVGVQEGSSEEVMGGGRQPSPGEGCRGRHSVVLGLGFALWAPGTPPSALTRDEGLKSVLGLQRMDHKAEGDESRGSGHCLGER